MLAGVLEVSLEDLDAVDDERRGFLRVSDDDANRDTLLSEQARGFCADLAGGGDENHEGSPFARDDKPRRI